MHYELEEIQEGSGFFGKSVPDHKYKKPYLLHIQYGENDIVTTADPYSFDPQLSNDDLYFICGGNHYNIYEKLGAHPPDNPDGVKGAVFCRLGTMQKSGQCCGRF